jgi:hypothetical protein
MSSQIDRELGRHFERIAPLLVQQPGAPLEAGVRTFVQATLARHVDQSALVRALHAQADRVGHAQLTSLWLRRLKPLAEAATRSRALALPHPGLSAAMLCRAVHHNIEMAGRDRPTLVTEPRFADELVCLICSYLQAARAGAPS